MQDCSGYVSDVEAVELLSQSDDREITALDQPVDEDDALLNQSDDRGSVIEAKADENFQCSYGHEHCVNVLQCRLFSSFFNDD